MTISSTAVLDQLVSLITSSVETIKAEYTKNGGIVPSLDSADAHPLDSQQSSELRMAVRMLEGACAQLTTTVANPYHTIINRSMATYDLACLRVVTEAKVADHLKSAGERGLPLFEIASKSGIEAGKLGRILRLLATKHVFREVAKDVFANNRLSILLVSNNHLSSTISFFTDDCMLAGHALFDTLSDVEFGPSYAPEKTAFTKAHNIEKGKTAFWWFNEKELERGARFGHAMIGWGQVATGVLRTAYPWSKLPRDSLVNDLGGGIGHASMDLARAYPHLKFVVQDLTPNIEKGRQIWKASCPTETDQLRLDFVPVDFFTETPVSGCDVYYLRHIIHNWSDRESVQILRGVRRAMKPGSKVLIHDYILQHVNRVSEQDAMYTQAPEPLLPNYGIGGIRQYSLDVSMMVTLNAKERTLDELMELGEQAGLKFLGFHDTGETGIVEYEMAEGAIDRIGII